MIHSFSPSQRTARELLHSCIASPNADWCDNGNDVRLADLLCEFHTRLEQYAVTGRGISQANVNSYLRDLCAILQERETLDNSF